MNISPANISILVMASSVNPLTEETQRDNKVREQIIPTKEVNATEAENAANLEERRQRQSSWQLSEHSTYSKLSKQKTKKEKSKKQARKNRSFVDKSYALKQGEIDYSFTYQIPAQMRVEIEKLTSDQNSRNAVASHYQQSIDPSSTSELELVV